VRTRKKDGTYGLGGGTHKSEMTGAGKGHGIRVVSYNRVQKVGRSRREERKIVKRWFRGRKEDLGCVEGGEGISKLNDGEKEDGSGRMVSIATNAGTKWKKKAIQPEPMI